MERAHITAALAAGVRSNLGGARTVAVTMSSDLKHRCACVDSSVPTKCHQGHCATVRFRAYQSKKSTDMGGSEGAAAGYIPFSAELRGDDVTAGCSINAGPACALSILSHGDYATVRRWKSAIGQ